MTTKFTLIAAFVLLGSTSAMAQSNAPAAENPVQPTSKTVATDSQGRALIGAPLGYNSSGAAGIDDSSETVFVIQNGTVKPSGEWTQVDREACKAAGGLEIPISAGRTACFRL